RTLRDAFVELPEIADPFCSSGLIATPFVRCELNLSKGRASASAGIASGRASRRRCISSRCGLEARHTLLAERAAFMTKCPCGGTVGEPHFERASSEAARDEARARRPFRSGGAPSCWSRRVRSQTRRRAKARSQRRESA